MNLFVLDKNLDVVAIVDVYTSLIWTDRYQEAGDFELHLPVDRNALQTLKQDYYLWRNDSEHTMIIEKLEIKSDPETGNDLIVTGRSLESILDRRVIWGLKSLSGNFQNGVKTLLDECLINPSKPERKIENFIFEASTDPRITELTIDTQYTGDNLYDTICALCKERDLGFKVTLNDNKQFVFKLYSGDNRSYAQFENPYVVFSPNFDNILDCNYMESDQPLKNVTLVGGEGEGKERRYTAVGNSVGMDRREIFTDARDLSSDADDDLTPNFVFTNVNAKTLTNIVPNSSFEKDSDWKLTSLSSYDSSMFYIGNRSLRQGANDTGTPVVPNNIPTPIAGHKYYGRVSVRSAGPLNNSDGRFELYNADETGKLFTFNGFYGNYPEWTTISNILDVTEVNANSFIIRCFVVNSASNVYFDGLMIIDLTACFGAGNEPTKEWMDENIPWFTGTYNYTVPGTTAYPNQVFDGTKNQFVTDNNFNSSMVDISRYAGRTLSLTIPKYNIKTGTRTDPDTQETVDVGGQSPYSTILVDKDKKYVQTLKKWEAYDDDTANKGSLETYEILLPNNAQYIYTSMYSQTVITNEVYYGEEGDFECVTSKVSNAEYITLLRQRGSETLAENVSIMNFEGEAETSVMYKYGVDFFMGDVVNIADDFGHEVTARVLELITSENEDGSTTTYPTFAMVESPDGPFIPNDYTVLESLRSTGSQWIDTGFFPDSNSRVVVDAEILGNSPGSTFDAIFGVRTSVNRNDRQSFITWYVDDPSAGRSFRSDYYSDAKSTLYDPIGKRVVIDKDKNVCKITNQLASMQGYTALDYIESNGTQYIRTGVIPKIGYKAIVDFQCTVPPPNTSSSDNESWILGIWESTGISFRAGIFGASFNTDWFTYTPSSPLTARVIAEGECESNLSVDLIIFGQNNLNNVVGWTNYSKYKLYSCKIYDDKGLLLREYLPCKNASGVVGLFDTVNQQFLTNENTTSFIAGPEIGPLNEVTIRNEPNTGKTPVPLYLFTCNSPDGVAAGSDMYNAVMKLYSCKIYDNGSLVRNFVPVRHRNGLVGLYDIANQVFYGNSGQGIFAQLPEGYTELEYIQSTGTQWIDTGVVAKFGFKAELDMLFTVVDNRDQNIIGAQTHISNPLQDIRNFLQKRAGDDGRWAMGCYDFVTFGQVGGIVSNTRYKLDFSTISGNIYCLVNGVKQNLTNDMATSNVRSEESLYLFTLNCPGVTISPAYMRLYSCKIYNEYGTLVREYIPCRNPDGVIGLYDLVNQNFVTNAGTGSFIAGEKGA